MNSFSAVIGEGYAKVEWITESEINNAGFNLYRSMSEDGMKAKLNEQLIPAKGEEVKGAAYSFTDKDIKVDLAYYYWLEEVGLGGERRMHGPVLATGSGDANVPSVFSLAQNHPNPFNPTTEIMYNLASDCHVRLEIFNVLGQKVATLVDEYQEAGSKTVSWHGRDASGIQVTSGIYFYKLNAGSFIDIKKMVLLK